MHMKLRMIACILALMLMVPGLALAGREGRLIGKVLDPEGNPIPGVTVTATSPEISDFQEVDATSDKGVFKVDFPRLFVMYHLRFEKEGFHSFTSEQIWELDGTARGEFTMHPGGSGDDTVPLASTSSEAILAYNVGVAAFNDKDYATAVAKFEEALVHDGNLHQAWAALCRIYIRQENYRKAVEAAEQALILGSTDESVWRWRWEAYSNLGDEAMTAEALKDLEQAGLRTEEAKRLHNEAVALSKAGDQEGAFAKFQKAVEVDPNLQSALLGVAVTGIEIDRNAEAAAAAEAVLQTDPRHEQALRVRYNAYLALGDEVRLFDALVGLVAVEPAVAVDGLLRLAFAAYDAEDTVQAKTRFTTILQLDPDQPQSHYYLGLIVMNEGATEEAKNHFERFLQLAPDAPEVPIATELVKRLSGP